MPIPEHVAAKVKVLKANAKAALAREIPDITEAEANVAHSSVDQDAIYDEQRSNLTVEVWDRRSPINGVPAQHFLDRDDVDDKGDDDIYLVKENGTVVLFQPHEPEVSGLVRIPKGKGHAKGNAHADNMAADRAHGKIIEKMKQKVLETRQR